MFKKIGSLIAGVAIVAGTATTASAGVYGELETLNPNGGTSASNGIKVDYAAGNMQITRNGQQQIYPSAADIAENGADYFCGTGVLPDPDNLNCVSSAWIVTLTSDGYGDEITIGAPDPYASFPSAPWADVDWTSVTSESTVDADGSGSIHTVMTYSGFDYCQEGCTSDIVLDVVIEYTYPNQFVTVTTNVSFLNLSGGYTDDWKVAVYYYEDATLSGEDDGNQFEGTDANGNAMAGVIRADGAALEGFREHGSTLPLYYAGAYECPIDETVDYCPDDFGGWTYYGTDLPNTVDATEAIDNGFAVQSEPRFPLDTIVGNSSDDVSYDLLFMACEVGTTDPTACIADGGVAGDDLASTGASNVTQITTAGAFAAALGLVAVIAVRRRSDRRA